METQSYWERRQEGRESHELRVSKQCCRKSRSSKMLKGKIIKESCSQRNGIGKSQQPHSEIVCSKLKVHIHRFRWSLKDLTSLQYTLLPYGLNVKYVCTRKFLETKLNTVQKPLNSRLRDKREFLIWQFSDNKII